MTPSLSHALTFISASGMSLAPTGTDIKPHMQTIQEKADDILNPQKTDLCICTPEKTTYNLNNLDLSQDLYINYDGELYDFTSYQKKILDPLIEIMQDEEYARIIFIISIIEHMGYAENHTAEDIKREIHATLRNLSDNHRQYNNSTSHAGATGLFQITKGARKDIKENFPVDEQMQKYSSILKKIYNFDAIDYKLLEEALISAYYFKRSQRYGAERYSDMAASYNGGIGVYMERVKKRIQYEEQGRTPPKDDNGTPEETENYIKKFELIENILIQNIEERKSNNELAFHMMIQSLTPKNMSKNES